MIILAKDINKILGIEISCCIILDRDYWSDEEIEYIHSELAKALNYAHIHSRKEIENYLLSPNALLNAINNDKNAKIVDIDNVNNELDEITENYRQDVESQYIIKRCEFLKHTGKDPTTLHKESSEIFKTRWNNLETRLKIVPGKKTLKKFRKWAQDAFNINISDAQIINSFALPDIPPEIKSLCNDLNSFRVHRKKLL